MSDLVCPYCEKANDTTEMSLPLWPDEPKGDTTCQHCEKDFEFEFEIEPHFTSRTMEQAIENEIRGLRAKIRTMEVIGGCESGIAEALSQIEQLEGKQ